MNDQTNNFFECINATWTAFSTGNTKLADAEAALEDVLRARDSDGKLTLLLTVRDSLPTFVEDVDEAQTLLANRVGVFRSRIEREIDRLQSSGLYSASEPKFPSARLAELFTEQVYLGDSVFFGFDEANFEMPIAGAAEINELLRRLKSVLEGEGVEPVYHSGRSLLLAKGYHVAGSYVSPFAPHGAMSAKAIIDGTREFTEQLNSLQAEAASV